MADENKLRTWDLKEIGDKLDILDYILMSLLAKRNFLALLVERFKHAKGDPIIRLPIEDVRIEKAAKWAEQFNINPHFARAIMYFIIDESCKVQLAELQKTQTTPVIIDLNDEQWYEQLKNNLLLLTEAIAPQYDETYTLNPSFAVASYSRFEEKIIKRLIQELPSHDLALDLGCATGEISLLLAKQFSKVIGFDISPKMIELASKKLTAKNNERIRFEIADIENGLPVKDSSVSLIIMNQGTAGDIRGIKDLIQEIERVLRKGGTALLSFYNADALHYGFKFIPWPVGLNAEINPKAECLDVQLPNKKIVSIFARAYTVEQIKNLFPHTFYFPQEPQTFPTLSSILPDYFFKDGKAKEIIEGLDEQLKDLNHGSYITVVVKKT